MTFIKHIVEQLDLEVVCVIVSVSALVTGTIVKKLTKSYFNQLPLEKPSHLETLKERLYDARKGKKTVNQLKTKILSFNKVLKRLDFQHKHIGSIAAYNKKYRKALNKYRKNKHLYDTLLPKLNSPYFNSLFNLKSHKSLLIAQNIELKSLLVNEPSKPWFSYLNQNFDLSIILIPIVLVGILYFCLIH